MTGTNRWWAFPWDRHRDEEWLATDSAHKLAELGERKQRADFGSTWAIATLHRRKYIGEMILNESGEVVADDEVARILELEAPPTDNRLALKIYNLGQAYDRVPCEISVRTIKEVHQVALTGLLDSAGVFRSSEAAPAGYAMYYYKSPMHIEGSLASLCTETNDRLAQIQDETRYSAEYVKKITAIAAGFLGKFLDIHPFANGNGRVGRLFVSCILSGICIVPVSLNIRTIKHCRDVYLDILEQARLSSPHDYRVLHAFVLEAVHRNIAQLHWWHGV